MTPAAAREAFTNSGGGCRLCDDYWGDDESLECACGMLSLLASWGRDAALLAEACELLVRSSMPDRCEWHDRVDDLLTKVRDSA